MPPSHFPLRWESTGEQWWYASPIDWAAANGCYDLVSELLHLDTNLLIKLTSLRRIRRLETVWDDEELFDDVAKCRSQVARKLLLDCESKKGQNSLISAGYGGWLLYTAACAGDVEFVKVLLEKEPLLVFGEGEYGVTDIFYAAARGKNSEVFRLLLDFSLSRRGCRNNREEMEGKSMECSSVFRWEMMNRAVHAAAKGGNVKILRELLGDCSDVLAYRDSQGSTLLHTASGRGQVEVVKYLHASYDIVASRDNHGNTALNVAVYRGYLAVVEMLIAACPSSASLTNNYGDTFLHMAVAGFQTPSFRRLDRQIELVKQLISGNIVNIQDIINVRNNDGRTALHMAVVENLQTNLVELFMSAPSINLNIPDADCMTPLDLLKHQSRSASSEILIKRLISAGGISSCEGHAARRALTSRLKMPSTRVSPGTSFRIPDAEIILYNGIPNASNTSCDPASIEFATLSGELSHFDVDSGSNSLIDGKFRSMSSVARHLKILFQWPRKKECKAVAEKFGDDSSFDSYNLSRKLEDILMPLRQRFSKAPSLPNSKRILSFRSNFPSPSTKRKFAAGLMQGVIQVVPHLAVESSSSLFSESSWSSPKTMDKDNVVELYTELPLLNRSMNEEKSVVNLRQGSFDKRLMNKYFCFGAQALAVEDSLICTRR